MSTASYTQATCVTAPLTLTLTLTLTLNQATCVTGPLTLTLTLNQATCVTGPLTLTLTLTLTLNPGDLRHGPPCGRGHLLGSTERARRERGRRVHVRVQRRHDPDALLRRLDLQRRRRK